MSDPTSLLLKPEPLTPIDSPFQPILPSQPPRSLTVPGARRHGPPRPPWWPEDEPWPPPRRSDRRGGFLRKVGCFFGVIIGLMVAASVLGAIFSDERGQHDGGPSWGFFFLILMIGGLFFV
jgi:hypothetical protein